VIISVSFSGLNTDFACTFLGDVVGLSEGGQIGVLLGLVTLTRVDSVLEAIDPLTSESLFFRGAAQWTLAFLVWSPWQYCIIDLTSLSRKVARQSQHPEVCVVFALFFLGFFVTVIVAFFNGMVHEHSTVATRFDRHFSRAAKKHQQQCAVGRGLRSEIFGVA
jgi:hypothetical protein